MMIFKKTKYQYTTAFFFLMLVLILLTIGSIQVIRDWDFSVDDSFISLRYAKHVAEGYGLRWNIGEPPVEGYSNFAYVVLASIFYSLDWPVLVSIKWFSISCLLASSVLLYFITRLWTRPLLALLPALFVLSYNGTTLWAVSGMETSFYQFLVLITVYLLFLGLGFNQNLNPLRPRIVYFGLAGLSLAFGCLTRPEAPVLFIIFELGLLYSYWKSTSNQKTLVQGLIVFSLLFLIIYVPYFYWRVSYFGQWFPNPVYCKFMHSYDNFRLIFDYLIISIPLLIAALPFLLKTKDVRAYFLWSPSLVYCVLLYGADPIVGYYNRHMLAAFTLLCVAAVLGIRQLFISETSLFSSRMQEGYILAVCLVFAWLLIPHDNLSIVANKYKQRNTLRTQVAAWLEQRVKTNQSVVLGDCGLIPLSAEKNYIDSLCLNSKEMTSPSIHMSYPRFIQWILKQKKPQYIILIDYDINTKSHSNSFRLAIQHKKQFIKDYHYVKGFNVGPIDYNYRYLVYERI